MFIRLAEEFETYEVREPLVLVHCSDESHSAAKKKEVGAEMVISVATHTRLTETERAAAKLTRLPPTMVKGKKQPVEIFSVA